MRVLTWEVAAVHVVHTRVDGGVNLGDAVLVAAAGDGARGQGGEREGGEREEREELGGEHCWRAQEG